MKKIDHHAFYGCKSLHSLELSIDIENIGIEVFGECESLRKVDLYSDKKECTIPLLHFVLIFGTVRYQSDGISKLLVTQNDYLDTTDPIYGMYPFLLAACTPRKGIWNRKNYNEKEHLETVYVLLHEAPWILNEFCEKVDL